MWSLVTSRGQRVALRSLPCVLGSEREGVDVTLPHASIAPRHARVEQVGDKLVLTAIDGAELEVDGLAVERAELAHGDSLVIGRVNLRLADDQAVTAPSRSVPAADPAQDEGELQLRGPAAAGAREAAPSSSGQASGARASSGRATRGKGTRGGPGGFQGASSQAGARRGPARHRGPEPLSFNARPTKRGLLHVDLSQLSGPARAVLTALLVLLAAGLAWGLSLAVAAG